MNKSSMFRKSFALLTTIFVSGQLIFASTNESMVHSESIFSMAVILVLVLLFVPFCLYIRKLQRHLGEMTEGFLEQNLLIEKKSRDLKSEKLTFLHHSEEIEKRYKEVELRNEELARKNTEQINTISMLTGNKKELEQLLVAKIKENDQIVREATDRQSMAERQIKGAEIIHDSFYIETIHEMRTPLSLVLGSLALIVQNKDRERDMSTQLLSAYRNTLAMQDFADQLIGTRRTNDISNYLRIARYDMLEITRQICDLFVDWVAMNKVDFRINTQTDVLWIWMDRRKMEFALRMLLTNAFKNTFAYGKVALDISVVREGGKAYCSLLVQDEGLDEEKSTRRGLKQIIDMLEDMGGIYHSDSNNNGTSYTLLIPLGKQHLLERRVEFVEPEADLVKLNDQQKEEIAELIQIIPQKKRTGKKLLVIDDSDQIRWFLQHVFNNEYSILEARNGQDGVDLALREIPDLVLCDVMMPVKDGYTTCREIKNDPRTAQVPVVMLTAKVESEDVITGIEAGADDYITKPFDVEILRTKINSLMKKREEMKRFYATNSSESEEHEGIVSNSFMDSVIMNIEKHLDDSSFEAKILADSLNMSLPTLYRKIKQYSDLSILELTRNIRLKKAAQLIQTQQYSVQEVAEMVGFNDAATFRKRFTEQYGVTPSQYGV